MKIGCIIFRFYAPRIPFVRLEIAQRMIFLARETEEPVTRRTCRNMRLIHFGNGKALVNFLMHLFAFRLVLVIERAAVLIHHYSGIVERFIAAPVKLFREKTLGGTERVG